MMDALFQASFLLVAPFWFAMIALPRLELTQRVVASPWIGAPAALLYLALVLPGLPEVVGAVANPTLAPIAAMLGTPEGATIAWVHFLAFDLFVGRWMYLDARARGIRWWVTSPLLCLTLMLGPAGLLAYLLARTRNAGTAAASA